MKLNRKEMRRKILAGTHGYQGVSKEPDRPCRYPIGTEGHIAELQRRAELGMSMYHKHDRCQLPDPDDD
ncbi:hypothetical protein AYO40_03465 [Planctomycetaceae bacterium SCGC AG-212-D15]|nr:hypothetical protein AYO40_03465 [Planctomycetaceae bacterium SCGC AG-212-D15]